MNTYYVVYPRDFANEYTVFAVGSKADALRFESACDLVQQITRVEALRLAIQRPREAAKDGEQWYGGFYKSDAYHALEQKLSYTISDQIAAVVLDTMQFVEKVEEQIQRNADYVYDQRNTGGERCVMRSRS